MQRERVLTANGRGFRRRGLINIETREFGAGLREGQTNRAANPVARSGHHRDFPGQHVFAHGAVAPAAAALRPR